MDNDAGQRDTFTTRGTAGAMREAATQFLRTLAAEQLRLAARPFEDDAGRRKFYHAPTWQDGLPLVAMTPPQRRMAQRLLSTGLSVGGHAIAAQIMGNENILDAVEDFGRGGRGLTEFPGGDGHERGRDPLLYFVSVYGSPDDEVWSWRFNGHHLSVNYCIVGETLAGWPMFFGAAPSSLPRPGVDDDVRLLGVEEDVGYAVLHFLDADARAVATISDVPPFDVTQPNRPEVVPNSLMEPRDLFAPGTVSEAVIDASISRWDGYMASLGWTPHHAEEVAFTAVPKGVPARAAGARAQAALRQLLRCHIERMPIELQGLEHDRLGREFDDLHFAWAGSGVPGEPCYYRVQGPTLLLEFANVQWHANHAHSLWRDVRNDFGRDLLATHLHDGSDGD